MLIMANEKKNNDWLGILADAMQMSLSLKMAATTHHSPPDPLLREGLGLGLDPDPVLLKLFGCNIIV